MDELLISSAANSGGLLFSNRSPADRSEPIDGFWVRVTDENLSAASLVYAGYAPSHPASLFADMARQWSGWSGELVWESLEGEMSLRCSHDRRGHISIGIKLCAGHMPHDWQIVATIMTEAGQLETIAQRAVLFFGQPW